MNLRQNFRGWVDEIYLPSPIALKREGPLEDETYPPSSHWPALTLVILRSYLVFRVCLDLVSLLWLVSKQCFTLRCPINYYASSGISPLTNLELPKLHPGLMDRSPSFSEEGVTLNVTFWLRLSTNSTSCMALTLHSRFFFYLLLAFSNYHLTSIIGFDSSHHCKTTSTNSFLYYLIYLLSHT